MASEVDTGPNLLAEVAASVRGWHCIDSTNCAHCSILYTSFEHRLERKTKQHFNIAGRADARCPPNIEMGGDADAVFVLASKYYQQPGCQTWIIANLIAV